MGSGSLSSSEVVRFWVGASGERPQFFTRLSVGPHCTSQKARRNTALKKVFKTKPQKIFFPPSFKFAFVDFNSAII